MMEKHIWIEKHYNKNFDKQITMDFWLTKFGPYFQKSQSWSFFVGLMYFSPNMYNIFPIYMDFWDWDFYRFWGTITSIYFIFPII